MAGIADKTWQLCLQSDGTCVITSTGGRLFAHCGCTWSHGIGVMNTGSVSDDQKWRVERQEGGFCVLVNTASQRRVYAQKDENLSAGFGATNTGPIYDDQKWQRMDSEDGRVIFVNVHSGRQLCTLDDGYGKYKVGAASVDFSESCWQYPDPKDHPRPPDAFFCDKFDTLVLAENFSGGEASLGRLWSFEKGWVRNNEDQCYTRDNVSVCEQTLRIEARREPPPPEFPTPSDGRKPRHGGGFTSGSLVSKFGFTFGLLEVEARIDARKPYWPAIWTTGSQGDWPHNGEVDLLEYYQSPGPTILANVAVGGKHKWTAQWHATKTPMDQWPEDFFATEPGPPVGVPSDGWHTWRFLWMPDRLELWLDDRRMLLGALTRYENADGSGNPFTAGHLQQVRLNLAVGGNGGDPVGAQESRYYVRVVRLYQGSNRREVPFDFRPRV